MQQDDSTSLKAKSLFKICTFTMIHLLSICKFLIPLKNHRKSENFVEKFTFKGQHHSSRRKIKCFFGDYACWLGRDYAECYALKKVTVLKK